MAKPHYRAVMLVLASDDAPIYKDLKRVFEQYIDKNPNIKVLFVYGSGVTFTPKDYDIVYPNVEETPIPGAIVKTIQAMQFIQDSYCYDFLIRTNLSTFWDFDLLLERLNTLPPDRCHTGTLREAQGRYPDGTLEKLHYFIAGLDLILSPDIVQLLLDNKSSLDFSKPEDMAIAKLLVNLGVNFTPSEDNIHFMTHFYTPSVARVLNEIDSALKQNHDHYRIKNSDRVLDVFIAECLLYHYYGEKIEDLGGGFIPRRKTPSEV